MAKAELIGLSQEILNNCANLDFLCRLEARELITLERRYCEADGGFCMRLNFSWHSEDSFLKVIFDKSLQEV